MRIRISFICSCVVGLTLLPTVVSADTWFSPYLGTLFGGSAGQGLEEAVEDRSDLTYGFSVGGMGSGVVGGELDLAFTPTFFGSDGAVESSSLTTIHGSLLLGVPIGGQTGGGLRPYGVVGLGLIRRVVEFGNVLDDLSTNDFGYNVGIGLIGFFGDVFGLRGEYRYFRNFTKDEDSFLTLSRGTFNVSRASVGVVFRF